MHGFVDYTVLDGVQNDGVVAMTGSGLVLVADGEVKLRCRLKIVISLSP